MEQVSTPQLCAFLIYHAKAHRASGQLSMPLLYSYVLTVQVKLLTGDPLSRLQYLFKRLVRGVDLSQI